MRPFDRLRVVLSKRAKSERAEGRLVIGAWVNGKPTVSKTVTEGSIPSAPANPAYRNLKFNLKRTKNMANRVANFFNDIKLEMLKVSWSTRSELIDSTILVLVSLAILSIFIGMCDLMLSKIVNIIMSRG